MRAALVLLCAAAWGPTLTAQTSSTSKPEAAADLAYEEKILKDAGIASDGPGLLAFFKAKILNDDEQKRLEALVKSLGDDSYAVREDATKRLLTAGRGVLRYVKPATDSSDAEVARRAREIVEALEQASYTTQTAAAVKVLAARKPAGTVEMLLDFLPWAEDESIEEAVFASLSATALKDGAADTAVVGSVTNKDARRRAAAAFVLGRANAAGRKEALKLLEDADVKVRFNAATALTRAGQREAVPVLIALLGDASLVQAWQIEDLLCRLAGDKNPAPGLGQGDEAARKKTRAAWQDWWKERGDKIDLAKVNLDDALVGLNIIIELDGSGPNGGGRVWECGPDGKARWSLDNVPGPIDARYLSGGRVLIAEHGSNKVTERDRDGKVLWEHKCNSQPVSVLRLPSGNTFIATYNEIMEVSRDNKVISTHKANSMLYHASRMRNGHVVYVTSNNQVIELDAAGKEVATVGVASTSGWASAEKLASGTYLVALYGSGKVVEVDKGGKVLWEVKCASPGHASRLPNGNTLVASIEGKKIHEFDRAGKEVWAQTTQGRPFHAHRR